MSDATQRRDLIVNGVTHAIAVRPDATLLEVLRDTLELTGTKEACGRGECGACTVLVDGQARVSCIELAALVEGEVTTIEGLADTMSPLRAAMANCDGLQCGFCTPGQVTHGAALLNKGSITDESELRRSLSGNICRCTGYDGIIDAVLRCLPRER